MKVKREINKKTVNKKVKRELNKKTANKKQTRNGEILRQNKPTNEKYWMQKTAYHNIQEHTLGKRC